MMRTPLRILLVLTSQATMGDELLNREWFRSRTEAKVLIERWRQFYNEQRPHARMLTNRRRRSGATGSIR